MGEKVKGRKRHSVTDTQGHFFHVKVHAANIHDTDAGCKVFEEAPQKYPTLKGVCADAGYRKTMEAFVRRVYKKIIEISARITPGWAIFAKRWVVEYTFAWLNGYRRLAKDFETLTYSAENFVMVTYDSDYAGQAMLKTLQTGF